MPAHGLSQNRDPDQGQQQRRRGPNQCASGILNGQKVPAHKDPRRESFWDMWRLTGCPDFKACSFTFILCVVLFVCYLMEVIFCMIGPGLDKYFFLGPNMKTHNMFGMRNPYEIKNNYHLHRLITPAFLHLGFTHILINCICLMMIGFILERNVAIQSNRKQNGCSFMFAIFFFSVTLGSLFACVCDKDKVAVGVEPAIFGFLAAILSMFPINWRVMGTSD